MDLIDCYWCSAVSNKKNPVTALPFPLYLHVSSFKSCCVGFIMAEVLSQIGP